MSIRCIYNHPFQFLMADVSLSDHAHSAFSKFKSSVAVMIVDLLDMYCNKYLVMSRKHCSDGMSCGLGNGMFTAAFIYHCQHLAFAHKMSHVMPISILHSFMSIAEYTHLPGSWD